VAEITRDGEMPARFDLNAIESGKAVDPLVKLSGWGRRSESLAL
jgi:hypothetical protein